MFVFGLNVPLFQHRFCPMTPVGLAAVRTDKQTHTPSLLPPSFSFTHTHTSWKPQEFCCIVGERERARSGSRPLHGTLERPNSGVPKRRGGGERGQGGKKTSRIKTTPNGMIVYMYPLWVWVCVDLFGEDGKLFTFDLFVSLPSAGR